jgi:CubicO group peptidase (beta-lactamase class C family)
MKHKLVHLLFLFALLPSFTKAQNLTTALNSIKQTHDLIGGVVIVFCKNQVIESIPFGTADVTRNIAVTDSTAFRIASISKAITAMAVMKLVQTGSLNLNTDINSILGYTVRNPNFPSIPITTRMLLSHTSSFIDGSTYNNFLNASYNNNPIPNASQLLSVGGTYYTTSQFTNTQPGTYFNYSNTNFGILGTIVEKISGQRFDQFCRQQLFIPLGIKGSYNVNDIANIDNVAVLYRKISNAWTAQSDNFQGIQPVFTNLTSYLAGTNGFRFAPQGGLRISGLELSKLFMALLNNGMYQSTTLLNPSSVSQMFGAQWTYNGNNGNNYYGLFRSWGLGIHHSTNTVNNDVVLTGSTQMLGHPGEAYGLISDAYIDTTRDIGFVFMTNGCGAGYITNANSAFYTVERQVFNAIEQYANLNGCLALGVNEMTLNELFTIYPNPSSGKITIHLKQEEGVNQLSIYDVAGKCVLASQTFIGLQKEIDLSAFQKGIYFVWVNGKCMKVVN